MVPQWEKKRDNKESRHGGYTNQGYRRERRMVTVRRADTEVVQIKGTSEEGEGRQ